MSPVYLLLTLLFCTGFVFAQTEQKSTAQIGIYVLDIIEGVILGEKLDQPYGLAVGANGQLYVVDAGNNRLLLFNDKMEATRDIGGFGGDAGRFDRPTFVTVDHQLNLYVTDPGNRRISRYDSRLNFVDEIVLTDDEDPLKFGEPSGLTVTPYGELWICDHDQNRLIVLNNVEQFSRFIGDFGYSGGQLSSPEKIVRTMDGRYVVCDAANSRLVVYDEFGNYRESFRDESFDYPMAVAEDSQKRLWVVDGYSGRLDLLSPKGKLLQTFQADLPGAEKRLKSPSDVAILNDSSLVVSDTGNDRLLLLRILTDR